MSIEARVAARAKQALFMNAVEIWAKAKKVLEGFQKATSDLRSIKADSPNAEAVVKEYAFLPNTLAISTIPDFTNWLKMAFDDQAVDNLENLRPRGAIFADGLTQESLDTFLKAVDVYEAAIQGYLSQVGPAFFSYKGFKIEDMVRIGPERTGNLLDAINFLVSLFTKRGASDLLFEGVHSIIVTDADDYAGIYFPNDQVIGISVNALRSSYVKLWTNWAQEVFIHEFGHHIHMTYIKGEARDFWDGTWDTANALRGKLETVTQEDLQRFFNLMEKNGFDPSKVARKLSGFDKIKFAYWLRDPGYGEPLITPKQFRLTKRGENVFGFFKDPEAYLLESRGATPNDSDYQRVYESVLKQRKSILGLGYQSAMRIAPEVVKELREADPTIESALEQEFAKLGIPSDYGKTNSKEDFADSFVVFMTNPSSLSENALYRMKRTLWLSGFGGKPVMKLAGRVVRRFRAAKKHYPINRRKLKNLNDPAARKESMATYGGYDDWRIEIVPIKDIRVPVVWNPKRYDEALKYLQSGRPIDPIRAHKEGGKWEIEDGIHRTNASRDLGYTHMPVLTSTWVETPEALVLEEPEKPQLPVGSWVKLREPFDSRQYGWVSERIGYFTTQNVKRWKYGLALVDPSSDWPDQADFSDKELDPTTPPTWGKEVEARIRAAGWTDT